MTLPLLPKSSNIWVLGLVALSTSILVGLSWYGIAGIERSRERTVTSQHQKLVSARRITALGRLEPQGEVIHVSAPLSLEKDRVAKLLVEQGDQIQAGEVIAILDSFDRLQMALVEAQEQVKVAQSRLAQTNAGAKTGEIQAQKAVIVQLEAELKGEVEAQETTIARWRSEALNAAVDYNRFKALHEEGVVAAADLDRKQLMLETTQTQLQEAVTQKNRIIKTLQAQINEAQSTLSRISEVRPVDRQVVQAEVDKAIATMKRAETDLNQARVLAPITGQVLKIHSRAGEKLSADGVVDMARTEQMMVIAEIYQTDIAKVRVGQAAKITSQAFEGKLPGTVSEVGLEVSQQSTFSAQPGENLDRRVVEVKIRLTPQASKQVAGLTNLQVRVEVEV